MSGIMRIQVSRCTLERFGVRTYVLTRYQKCDFFVACSVLYCRWLVQKCVFFVACGVLHCRWLVSLMYISRVDLPNHVSRLIRTCFYQLHRLKCIRRSLSISTAIQLINSSSREWTIVTAFLLVCRNIQYRIQSIPSVAARLIFDRGCHDHVTLSLRDRLHWLRVPQRIEFKLALLQKS